MNTYVRVLLIVNTLALTLCETPFASAQAPSGASAVAKGNSAAPGVIPNATDDQSKAVGAMTMATLNLMTAVSAARTELAAATFAEKKDEAVIRAKADALAQAELKLALRRADEFATIQAGPNKLTPEQVAALIKDYATRTVRGVAK